jgi:hypothetical protein
VNWIKELVAEIFMTVESVRDVDFGMNPEPMMISYVT